ncbi:MAG: hypothetical protein Kow00129_01700 [Thermoleophilia bacterium]
MNRSAAYVLAAVAVAATAAATVGLGRMRRRWFVTGRSLSKSGSRPAPGVGGTTATDRAPEAQRDVPVRTDVPADTSLPEEAVVYQHFQAGVELLESGNPAQAAVRLQKARRAAPGKASIREALGRAYFALGRWQAAEEEFRAVIEIAPTNDYAHFALGRSLQRQGLHEAAQPHLKLARAMRGQERSESETERDM